MALNLGFQTKYILNPWSILVHPAKVPLKVFSILFKVHWACCEVGTPDCLSFGLNSFKEYCVNTGCEQKDKPPSLTNLPHFWPFFEAIFDIFDRTSHIQLVLCQERVHSNCQSGEKILKTGSKKGWICEVGGPFFCSHPVLLNLVWSCRNLQVPAETCRFLQKLAGSCRNNCYSCFWGLSRRGFQGLIARVISSTACLQICLPFRIHFYSLLC